MEHLIQGLRRYFPRAGNTGDDPAFFLMRCLLFRSHDLASGFAVIYDGRLLTFTDEDCLVADTRQGHPRVGLLRDISECSVQGPSDFRIPSTTYVRIDPTASPRNDAVSIVLTFGEGGEAGDEALIASTGIGGALGQRRTAETIIGTFISHVDAALSNAQGAGDDDEWIDCAAAARDVGSTLQQSEQEKLIRSIQRHDVEDQEQRLIDGFLRYLEDFSGPMKWLQCSLVQPAQTLPGFAVITGHTFWFFDYYDCLVDDIAEGSPVCLRREEIVGCSVMKPVSLQVHDEESLKIEFLPSVNERLISIIIETRGPDVALISTSGQDLDPEECLSIEKNVDGFIHFIDWAFLRVAHPIPASVCQDVAQHFAARGVLDMSASIHAPAKLYLERDFLPGFVVAVGHLLGFFPDDHAGNHIEQDPYLISVRDVTDIHLSIPEGLPLLIPQGVRSSTILNGNVLGLYISLKTTHMSLVLDFPRDDDAGRERERIRRFIDGLLALYANIRGI